MTAAMDVTVSTSGRGWPSAWPERDLGAEEVLRVAARAMNLAEGGAVEVEYTSDAAIRTLNQRFRSKDKSTNVLSFPNPQMPFGAIVLAFGTLRREAKEQEKPFLHHVKHMILHGFLHLIGHGHETVAQRRLMERLEIRILRRMGIPNPYLLPNSK